MTESTKTKGDNARDAAECINKLIQLGIEKYFCCDAKGLRQINEQIEIQTRLLTDYLLATDPRKGIYVKGRYD